MANLGFTGAGRIAPTFYPGAAFWGPGNDVIIGGYRLHMAAE